jgi:aspartate carbamoyltransferase catalytic subunit
MLIETPCELSSQFVGRDIISMSQFTRDEIESILDYAEQLQQQPATDLLRGKVLASCFFEPSTRTRLSFETAMLKLGGHVIGFSSAETTSVRKGESLHDTMRVIGEYADLIVIRHPIEGAARQAADATDKPVINAGDGANQHPTQTLLDLLTIKQTQGRLDELHIACVGDLRYGRTVHSLVQAMKQFAVRLYFVAPPTLELPAGLSEELKAYGTLFSYHRDLEEILPKLDIIYMTRIQEERMMMSRESADDIRLVTLTAARLRNAKPNLRVLHPLPRRGEITRDVDATPHAAYFAQAANGICVRQALLSLVLGIGV